MIETETGVRFAVEGTNLNLQVDLDQVESQIREYRAQGHQVGGYLLGIPVARADTSHLGRAIGAYAMDRVFVVHTHVRMYREGNPLMAKWYLEQTGENGLFILTEEQLNAFCNAKRRGVSSYFDQNGVDELQETRSIKVVDGWCFPGEGALEHIKLDEDQAREIQVQVKRGERVVQEYKSSLGG